MAANPAHSREQAWRLLTEWTQSESLRKHALAVEACVVACGRQEAARLGLGGDALRGAGRALLHHRPAPRLRLRAPSHGRGTPVRRRSRARAAGLARRTAHRHSGPRAVLRRAAHDASRQGPVCLRRTGRLSHRLCAGQAHQGHRGCRSGERAKEDERQGLRPRRPPRRHRAGRSRARRRSRCPHRLLH